MEGALRCLQDRGYARTTARDIAAAAGTNLGAIGYHYGSTERLKNLALEEGFTRWFHELAAPFLAARERGAAKGLAGTVAELPASYERNRPFALAFIEALAQAEHSTDIRSSLAEAYEQGREGTLSLFAPLLRRYPEADRRVIASAMIALFDGWLLQWLVDPGRTPTGGEVLNAIGQLSPRR